MRRRGPERDFDGLADFTLEMAIASARDSEVAGVPAILSTTSPLTSPISAAGEPGNTPATPKVPSLALDNCRPDRFPALWFRHGAEPGDHPGTDIIDGVETLPQVQRTT